MTVKSNLKFKRKLHIWLCQNKLVCVLLAQYPRITDPQNSTFEYLNVSGLCLSRVITNSLSIIPITSNFCGLDKIKILFHTLYVSNFLETSSRCDNFPGFICDNFQ